MKILILRFSSFGDIVLTTPVIRILKSQDWTVHFATMEEFSGLLEANPYIDKIHLLKASLHELTSELKAEQFDRIIDLQNNNKTKLLSARLKKKRITFRKLNFANWLLVNFKINRLPNVHLVDRYIQAIEPLGVKNDNLGLDYFIPEKDEVEDGWLPDAFQGGFAAFVIAARHKTRQLPLNRMIELCDRINKPVILVGGKKEVGIGNKIEAFFKPGSMEKEVEMKQINKKTIIFNACGKFSLNQSASLISKAKWVFTHDTGMMQVAAAFKKPVYSIWGNTVPAFGTYPYRTQFTIFENKSLSCRPCSTRGYNKCPKGHFKCMKDLSFDFYLPD
ncbi:MAG: glycosyltransferase family 9 protein [Cyclobacteriaceae bacterium]